MVKMISEPKDIGFTTWTCSNDQFGKYPFNEYQLDLTDLISLSAELSENILKARTTLNNVDLLDDKDIFKE